MESPIPPVPPPKPSSSDTSRIGTPSGQSSARHVLHPQWRSEVLGEKDPGDHWLPRLIQSMATPDVVELAAEPRLLSALTQAPEHCHPSLAISHQSLDAALSGNLDVASGLLELESRVSMVRTSLQAQLLSTHALERQWKQKQSDMDLALGSFSPASLYQRLSQGIQEQGTVCHAIEESFLEGDGSGAPATERETLEWLRRYRDSKTLYYLRQERKERWDEGRVGGWR